MSVGCLEYIPPKIGSGRKIDDFQSPRSQLEEDIKCNSLINCLFDTNSFFGPCGTEIFHSGVSITKKKTKPIKLVRMGKQVCIQIPDSYLQAHLNQTTVNHLLSLVENSKFIQGCWQIVSLASVKQCSCVFSSSFAGFSSSFFWNSFNIKCPGHPCLPHSIFSLLFQSIAPRQVS